MKATKNILTAFFKTVLLLLLIAFQSCNTYRDMTSGVEADLYSGNFQSASANLDMNKFLQKDRNRLLYLMEKGKIEHLLGNYESSNNYLEQAYIMIDDRIRTNVGQAISSKFTNPMAEPYKGEDFEKVTIHYYKALNYFHLGMPNEALVEAKRINIKLYELNEKYSENKNKYSEDAFSQILQGILYESTGDINNAFIAYRNAEEIYSKNDGSYFGVPLPEQLKSDLLRTSKAVGFMEEHNNYRTKFNIAPDPVPAKPKQAPAKGKKGKKSQKAQAKPEPAHEPEKPKEPEITGEAIVFWENGLGPAKDQIIITASGGSGIFYGTYMDGDVMEEIIIPIPIGSDIGSINAIAIPKYTARESYYSKAAIMVGDKEQDFQLAQDFYPIAKQCLKDRMLREVIGIVTRFAVKKAASEGAGAIGKELFGDLGGELVKLGADAAGAATEKADTRNWQSLPSTIAYSRVPLKEGENKFLIKKYGPMGIDTDTLTIPYKRGLQIVNYFDLGRTQSTYHDIQVVKPENGIVSNGAGKQKGPMLNLAAAGATSTPATLTQTSYKAADGVTAQEVVNKYISAVGGNEKLQSVETIYQKTTSKTTVEGNVISTEMISKMNSRNDCSIQSYTDGKLSMTITVNDHEGYMVMDGNRTKLDKATIKTIKNNRTFYQNYTSPLSSSDLKLNGITKINGEDVYMVSFTENINNVAMVNYYSLQSGLLVACKASAQNFTTTSYFLDYRDVNGLKIPFKSVSDSNGTKSETITTSLLFNEGVTDADFK